MSTTEPLPAMPDKRSNPLHGTDLRRPPPQLYGRYRRDPFLVAGTAIAKMWWPFWGRFAPLRETAVDEGVTRLVVTGREVVADDEDVVALTLMAPGPDTDTAPTPDGPELPPWYPGAHIDLLLPSGRMREYSLCGDPADRRRYRIAVRRIPDGGGGSIEVHESLTVGTEIRIKGPRNAFPLALPGHGSPARSVRFIAAGIGITPILPMLAAAERLGLDWSMIYTGRTRDSIPFLDEVAAYGDRIIIRTDDEHGLPSMDELIGIGPDGRSPEDLAVYACGPVPILEALRAHLLGRPDIELHYERFSPPPVIDGQPFRLTLARSGREVEVAADQTALQAMTEIDPAVAYSCRQGFCGTCKVRVLDGIPEHRDGILTDTERAAGAFLPCVSRAAADGLVIDR